MTSCSRMGFRFRISENFSRRNWWRSQLGVRRAEVRRQDLLLVSPLTLFTKQWGRSNLQQSLHHCFTKPVCITLGFTAHPGYSQTSICNIHRHLYTYAQAHIRTCTHMHKHNRAHTCTYAHRQLHTHIHTSAHATTHMRTHTYTLTYVRTHNHTHAHTCTF